MPDNNVDYKRYAEISKLILRGYEEKAFNDVNGMTKYIIDNHPDVENRELLKVLVDKKNQAVVSEVKVESFSKLESYNSNREIYNGLGKTINAVKNIHKYSNNFNDIIEGAIKEDKIKKKIEENKRIIDDPKTTSKDRSDYENANILLENERKHAFLDSSRGFLGGLNNILSMLPLTKGYAKLFSEAEKKSLDHKKTNTMINYASYLEALEKESRSTNPNFQWIDDLFTKDYIISDEDIINSYDELKKSEEDNKKKKFGLFNLFDTINRELFQKGGDKQSGDSKKIYTDEEIDKLLKRVWDLLKEKGKSPTPPKKGGDYMGGKSPEHLNEGRKNAKRRYDPLVVDLENDGFDMLNSENGVHFDLDGDILKEKTTWISKKDGFLSIDLNDNGKIDNGAELFGDTFMLADGKYAKSAIEALTSLDKNRDGVIDAKDEVYSKLRIWRDENGNGISEDGELKSLADYNITSININDVKDENVDINGSTLEKTISFERQEKIVGNNVEKIVTSKGKIGEFLLERDIIDSIDEDILSTIPKDDAQSQAIIERIKKLPNIRSYGKVRSLHNEMFLDKSGELLGLVENFVNSKDSEEKNEILDKILIKLGKAENISDTQSGQYINGKYVKIMETFFGEELERGSLSFLRAGFYNETFSNLKLMYYSMLTINSVFKDMQDAFDIEDNKLVNIKAFNRYIRLATMADLENAGNIFDSASRVLLYLKSLGIEGFDEFKDYFGNISSGYIDRIGKLNYKIITGTDKSDSLYSYQRGVTMIGGDGDDKVEDVFGTLTEDDYFYGGKGNDIIYGGLGSDTYIFNLGDGQDIIRENVNGKDKNVIALGKGITKDNVIFKRLNETDLEIKVKGTEDKITVKGQFGNKSAIDKVYFYEGGSLTDADINEILTHITDGDDYIKFGDKDNYIDLLDGDDVVFAGKGNDTIICGKGNDVLDAGNGNNTFIYNVGDGHDIISAGMYGYNKIVFGEGIKKEDLIIAHTRIPESRMGIDEVTIAFKNNNNDSLKISSQQHSPIINLLQFADGSTMDYKEMKEMFSKASILNDHVVGTYGDDKLYGLEGNDRLVALSGDDILDGGTGDDYLQGEGGNDTYVFGRGYGVDRICDLGWNEKDDKDTILFKEGITKDDLEFTRTASDVLEIKIKDTNDKIILERLFDAKNGVEQFKFADGTVYKLKDLEKELSVIRGTVGDDKLSAFDGRNFTLQGYDGNDEIRGSYGDDILDGGTGNDSLYGGGGNDTYIFGRGYGIDTIYDDGGKLDTIEFKEGISMDDLEFVRISSDVGEIRIKNSEDKIVLRRLFDDSERVEQLRFADGTIRKLEDIRKKFAIINGTDKAEELIAYDSVTGYTIYAGAGNDSIYGGSNNDVIYGQEGYDSIRSGAGDDILEGGAGNDYLSGGAGNDTYVFGRGDGVDIIDDSEGGLDTILFKEGISKEDLIIRRTGAEEGEIRIKDSNDRIILKKLFNDRGGVEQLKFSDGSIYKFDDYRKELNELIGTDGADSLIAFNGEGYKLQGGAGNDYLQGGAGDDTYIFGRGDGVDTIQGSGGGLDTILFKEGIKKEDLIIRRTWNNEAEIRIKDTNDKIILRNLYDKKNGVNQLKFSDGSIYKIADLREEFATIRGSASHENLYAYDEEVGNTVYAGGGDDTIYGSKNADKIYGEEGSDYILARAGDDVIYGGVGNDTIYGEEGNDVLEGGVGNDALYGGAGNDTYIFGRGDGVDTINDYGNNENDDKDTILFKEGITKEDLVIRRTGRDEAEIRIKDTNDKIVLRDLFDKANGVEQLKFSDGSIYKIADLREEFATIRGSASHENLYAYDEEVGNTVYAGGGDDTIYGSKNADKIYGEEGSDYILARAGDDVIYGGVGNDTIYGEEGNDVLEGGVGNDALYGGAGNDTYIFGRGDGVDTINDYGNNENDDKDTILFKEGITKEDLVIRRTGSDEAEIRIKDTDDRIILRSLFDKANGVEQLKFSDGSIYKIADLREEFATTRGGASSERLYAEDEEVGNTVYAGGGDDYIYGSKNADKIYGEEGGDYILARAGDDIIYGGVGNDTIYGEEGNDILEGGVGNDALYGGVGNDTYVFSKGDGKDTIYDEDYTPGNKDKMQLGYDILNTVFKQDGSNLCIGFADSTDTITINNWYSGSSYQIEEIKSSDNRSITNVQLQLMIDAMAAYTKEKGIDWNTAVKQNPNEVNNILQNFWVSNSN